MLSSEEIERLISKKKRDIFEEKVQLGIVPIHKYEEIIEDKEYETAKKQVSFKELDTRINVPTEQGVAVENNEINLYDIEEPVISRELERYIRRYNGLPGMLKAGEYSPNNPLLRGERGALCGDALLGLGEYERRRDTLRRIRQAQYREHLDRQAKKKQEAKDEAERERREQERKDREREERERQLLQERERYSPERRVSVSDYGMQNNKVDSSTQMDGVSSPLSVAVQTDDSDIYRHTILSPCKLTTAERELSPRTVDYERPPPECRRRSYGDGDDRTLSIRKSNRDKLHSDLRHSYMASIFDADAIQLRNEAAEKEAAERRQFYQQELKNQILEQQRIREERKSREKLLEQAEMRRLEEQLRMLREAQEKEIGTHQDILTAAKTNAKEYETKRTELQRDIDTETQKLRASSHPTRNIPNRIINTSNSDTKLPNFNEKYQNFQSIDKKPYSFNIPDNSLFSPNYDVDSYLRKNLNFKNMSNKAEIKSITKIDKRNSIENEGKYENYDRRNSTESNLKERFQTRYRDNIESVPKDKDFRFLNEFRKDIDSRTELSNDKDLRYRNAFRKDTESLEFPKHKEMQFQNEVRKENVTIKSPKKLEAINDRRFVIEKALIHEPKPIEKPKAIAYDIDNLSVPVLRHSPKKLSETDDAKTNLSDAMKKVDEKWKIPAVQKNILKSLPSEGGNISILTQLGSIRRQLQLEQLKLDKMIQKD